MRLGRLSAFIVAVALVGCGDENAPAPERREQTAPTVSVHPLVYDVYRRTSAQPHLLLRAEVNGEPTRTLRDLPERFYAFVQAGQIGRWIDGNKVLVAREQNGRLCYEKLRERFAGGANDAGLLIEYQPSARVSGEQIVFDADGFRAVADRDSRLLRSITLRAPRAKIDFAYPRKIRSLAPPRPLC